MDIRKLKAKYESHKWRSAKRGIEFKLTFQEWVDWWGDDIHRIGLGKYCLGMQRIRDQGAYELGNIVKGTPRQNMITRGHMQRVRRKEREAAFEAQYQELMTSMGIAACPHVPRTL